MKKIWFILFGVLVFSAFASVRKTKAAENIPPAEEAEWNMPESEGIHYGNQIRKIVIKELPAEEDDLYDGIEIKPMEKNLSEEEQGTEGSSDLEIIEEDNAKLPEISCNDPKLKEQVKDFIYNNLTKISTNSVVEKRARVLLVNNLHEFVDVTDEEIDGTKNFSAASASAYLRINGNKEISRICRSQGNSSKQFNDLYVIIYPYIKYYKVVVTNLMVSTDKIDEASFIYNW